MGGHMSKNIRRFCDNVLTTKSIGLVVLLFVVGLGTLEAGETGQGWRDKWAQTVAAAKKEGQVTIYTPRNQSEIINAGVFQKRYPEIKISHLALRAGPGLHRLIMERRAGKYLVDIRLGGGAGGQLIRANVLDPIRSALILPEVLDESKWWLGKHRYEDPDQRYVFIYIGAPKGVIIYYNTKLVDPKELSSLKDLLNPKWRGKIVTYDMRGGGAGGGTLRYIYYHPKLGPDFLRRLFRDTQMTFTRDYRRQATDWLATGKFAICFVCNRTEIQRARAQGLPVDVLYFDSVDGIVGLTGEGGTVGLVNRAPHPNAAKVFINWLLSREGQVTAQRALAAGEASDSLRIDIPKDDVPRENRRKEGLKYINLQDPSRMDMRPIYKIIGKATR